MKRPETIIKEMYKLERELYKNYTAKQIVDAFEKLGKMDINNCPKIDSCTGQLYDAAYTEIELDEFCNSSK